MTSCCRAVDAFLTAASDITSKRSLDERQERLFDALFSIMPCDAAALLSKTDGVLVPIATKGLRPDAMGKKFHPEDHPRLKALLAQEAPITFGQDSALPDPFEGLYCFEPTMNGGMGAAVRVGEDVVGVLLIDFERADAVRRIDARELSIFAAFAAANLQSATLSHSVDTLTRRQRNSELPPPLEFIATTDTEILGHSEQMLKLKHEIRIVADADLSVLITGETGTGKELVAKSVHARSSRSTAPLVYVNCAALPESIAESELFGHVKGAYTGADGSRVGKFELADGGTLFLDEIGELPLSVQPKLLRAIQSGEIQRLGSDRNAQVDVRIIAATNRNLKSEVASGRFRIDLFHRISVYPIEVPPLRERGDDIGVLAGHFLDRAIKRLGLGPMRLGTDALAALLDYSWPGNVRELDHVVTRSALRAATDAATDASIATIDVTREHLDLNTVETSPPVPPPPEQTPGLPLKESVIRHKRKVIADAVRAAGGNWAEAARRLGLHRSNLYRTAKQVGLNPSRDSG